MSSNANVPNHPNTNELIHAILHGNITKGFPEPPPRVVKLFISSTKTDFECERQHLHDLVIPKLERYCNSLSLDLLVVDPHWQTQPIVLNTEVVAKAGDDDDNNNNNNNNNVVCNGRTTTIPTTLNTTPTTASTHAIGSGGSSNVGPKSPTTVTPVINDPNSNCINPHEFELQLKEIEDCAYQSAASFFMCLIGHKYRPIALPTVIPTNDFQQIFNAAAESGLGDVSLLRSCYKENRNLQPAPQYVLLEPRRASRQYEEELEHIAKLVEYGSKVAAREGLLSDRFGTVMSAVHQQTLHALEVARMINAGQANSPTTKSQISSQLSIAGKHLGGASGSGSKTSRHHFGATSGASTTTTTSKLGKLSNAPHEPPPGSPATRRAKASRLMHQASLQQGPTQQKISMPRQTSVTTNYALMQQPIDRMLCFIRQFEGVNFNNACITKFFDVTPTSMLQEDAKTGGALNEASLFPSSGNTLASQQQQQQQQQQRPLFAPIAQNDIQQLIEDVILGLKKGNVHYFNISWSPPEMASLQTRTYTLPEHYIERFGETVLRTLKSSIDSQLTLPQNALVGLFLPGSNLEYPVDIIREAHSHLSNFRRVQLSLGMAQAMESDFAHLLQVRELLVAKAKEELSGSKRATTRHQPIVVTGRQGAGKSTLLAQVFTYAPEWLAEATERDLVIRIVRQCGQSLSSNFASELLRSLCLQIAVAYGFDSHLVRCGEAHELSELALCFQELLKLIETTPGANSSDLLVILDDLHHLQSALQSSALLGWMPWNLPSNVHFICSVATEANSVLAILRSRIANDNFVHLDDVHPGSPTSPNQQQTVVSSPPISPMMPKMSKGQQIFSMVQCKLRDEKRTLTAQQWDFVRQKLIAPGVSESATASHAKVDQAELIQPEEMTPLYANLLASAVLSTWESFYVPDYLPLSVKEIVMTILVDLEECLPYTLVRLMCSYLTCTKYGFREPELHSLVQDTLVTQVWPEMALPKAPTEAGGTPEGVEYPRTSSATWLLFKVKMKHLLKEYYVQGHLYLNWRSPKVASAVMERYLNDPSLVRNVHQELASAFSSSYSELQASHQQLAGARPRELELVREADELWYHYLCAGNREQLKSHALLNIKFLMTITEGVSVCYLRCILDAVRSQILDWDVELLYGMLKQSVHVVAQDSSQLAVESILWLTPFVCPANQVAVSLNQLGMSRFDASTSAASHLEEFLRQAYRACLDYKHPLLYPANVWLNLPLPPQVTMITSPWAAMTRAASTPDSQHLIVCEGRMLHFYHVPTKTVTKSFEGHKSTITCLHLSGSGRYLATGCNDSTVNLWLVEANRMSINECKLRFKLSHHSAGVLCVTINTADTLLLSGSEMGAICVVNVRNGQLLTRLEHHRGMVTCLNVNSGDDVLVSGSTDRTVVIWSLETFCILNEILLMRPVLHMDISLDSTFLLLSLDDNSLHLRALTTGTAIHSLQPTASTAATGSSVISYVRLAEDNCRAVVGYANGRILVFDIHSARQLQTLNGHTEMITAILPQKNDHFLITCGGNKIIVWNFYPVKRIDHVTTIESAGDKTLHEALELVQNMNLSGGASGNTGGSFSEKGGGGIDSSGSESIGAGGSSSAAKDEGKSSSGGTNSRTSSDRRKHKPTGTFKKKSSIPNIEHHREPITCATVSRDGQYVISGGRDCLVKIWQTFSGETHTTLDEHSSPVTCVDIAPNSQIVVSGCEDGLIKVWSMALSLFLCTFTEHQGSSIVATKIMSDSKRVLSADIGCVHRLWLLDTGVQVRVIANKPIKNLMLHGHTALAIGGKIENCVKYWSCYEPEAEKTVSHSDTITCFTCTHSGKTIITGSLDMSLKVWEAATAKLTQVLVGHEGGITCVATAALNETLVVSGAQDCNLIVWDMTTGSEVFTLAQHNASIMGVILTPDGRRALSYSEDNTLQLWDIESGQRLSMLDVHRNFTCVFSSLNVSYLAVLLGGNSHLLPIVRHHNNPAHGVWVELPAAGTPVTTGPEEKSTAWLRGLVGGRHAKTLKREQTYDSSYFEHILHRGQSVDDFRKIGAFNVAIEKAAASGAVASPYGSREQLWTSGGVGGAGGIYDGTTTAGATIPTPTASTSTRNRMISKLMNIGPKQKMLKKQQSMFACFPEFTGKPPGGGGITSAGTTDILSSLTQANGTKKSLSKVGGGFPGAAAQRPIGRTHSVGDDDELSAGKQAKNGHDNEHSAGSETSSVAKVNTVTDSSVCSIT